MPMFAIRIEKNTYTYIFPSVDFCGDFTPPRATLMRFQFGQPFWWWQKSLFSRLNMPIIANPKIRQSFHQIPSDLWVKLVFFCVPKTQIATVWQRSKLVRSVSVSGFPDRQLWRQQRRKSDKNQAEKNLPFSKRVKWWCIKNGPKKWPDYLITLW